MKNFKKIASAIAALSLAACVAVPMSATVFTASAETAGTYTITINEEETGYTYAAYQIFSGDLKVEDGGEKILSNIKWGKSLLNDEGTALKDGVANAIKAVNDFSSVDCTNAAKVAEALTEDNAEAFVKAIKSYLGDALVSDDYTTDNKYELDVSTHGAGYYLVENTAAPTGGAYTSYILQVLGKTEGQQPKSVKPTVDKQVADNDGADSTPAGQETNINPSANWGETADHAINESFQFKLTATLTADENYDAYEKYTVRFSDIMSTGVTFDSIESVKLTCGTSSVSWTATDVDSKYTTDFSKWDSTPYDGDGAKAWTLTIDDLKGISDFDWDTTKDATIEVIYNAHLNAQAKANNASGDTTNANTVKLQYSNNPNASGSGDKFDEHHGDTPEDSVWVFTYESDNSKVQPDTGESTKPLTGAVFELYKGNDTSSGTLMKFYTEEIDGTTYYIPYDATIIGSSKIGSSDVAASQGTGKNEFKFKGLDAGTYTLHEKTTPNGFNTCPDTTFTITATHKENAATEGTKNNVTLSAKNGETDYSLTNNTVLNQKGAELPSTGGIGTTLFYLGGGALVAVAGVMLITKKRMTKE